MKPFQKIVIGLILLPVTLVAYTAQAEGVDLDWLMCKKEYSFTCLAETAASVGEGGKPEINSTYRSYAYADLGLAYAASGNSQLADKYFMQAQADAALISEPTDRSGAYGYIVGHLAMVGRVEQGEKLLEGITEGNLVPKAHAMADFGTVVAKNGDKIKSQAWFAKAAEEGKKIDNAYDRGAFLQYFARRQAEAGDFASAMKTVDEIENANARASALALIARAIVEKEKNLKLLDSIE